MGDLREFVRAPAQVLVPGQPLGVDVYLFLPLNDAIIHFRQVGEQLSAQDIDGLRKISACNIMILRSDQQRLLSEAAQPIAEALKAGQPESPEVQASAREVLSAIQNATPARAEAPSPQEAGRLLAAAGRIVEEMVSQIQGSHLREAYERALDALKQNPDPLDRHQSQVSSLAVLLMLSSGPSSMEELSDLALAGLVHDLGLRDLPEQLLKKYLGSECEKLIASEKITYMKHPELSIQACGKLGVTLSQGAAAIIVHHHENWDGSGFKAKAGNKIYKPSRFLRLADAIVNCMNHPECPVNFREAVNHAAQEKGGGGQAIHDPAITTAIQAIP